MINDIITDVKDMHHKYKVHDWIKANPDKLDKLLKLRMRMLTEEFSETMDAYLQSDPEELVDGLIDLVVIAIGTLDIVGVDPSKAWNQVKNANMSKEVGVKPGRANPLGLPDLVKPSGWTPPNHKANHGKLPTIM
jgi:hypothetical protein